MSHLTQIPRQSQQDLKDLEHKKHKSASVGILNLSLSNQSKLRSQQLRVIQKDKRLKEYMVNSVNHHGADGIFWVTQETLMDVLHVKSRTTIRKYISRSGIFVASVILPKKKPFKTMNIYAFSSGDMTASLLRRVAWFINDSLKKFGYDFWEKANTSITNFVKKCKEEIEAIRKRKDAPRVYTGQNRPQQRSSAQQDKKGYERLASAGYWGKGHLPQHLLKVSESILTFEEKTLCLGIPKEIIAESVKFYETLSNNIKNKFAAFKYCITQVTIRVRNGQRKYFCDWRIGEEVLRAHRTSRDKLSRFKELRT